MTRRYFAFTSPAAIEASRTFIAQRTLLRAQGKAIGDVFGGIPHYSHTLHGITFLGLRFAPPLDSPLWTKPDPTTGTQRPRTASTSRLAAGAPLVDLRARYESLKPTAVASLDEVFQACGTSWDDLMFQGVGYHCADNAVYLAVDLDLSQYGQEITGSEFDEAKWRSAA